MEKYQKKVIIPISTLIFALSFRKPDVAPKKRKEQS